MKKLRLIKYAFLMMTTVAIVGCQSSSSDKLKDAKSDVAAADEKLIEASKEYEADLKNYKAQSNVTISANEQSIKEFKARMKEDKKAAKTDYDKKINDLNQQNSDMKRKLDEIKIESNEQWTAFKREFSHDMDELGAALKDLTVDNAKN